MTQVHYSTHTDILILLKQGIKGLRVVAEVQIQDEELSNLKQKESSDCVLSVLMNIDASGTWQVCFRVFLDRRYPKIGSLQFLMINNASLYAGYKLIV